MHSVRKIPDGLELPDVSQLISGRPTFSLHDSIDWINSNEPVPVFIERFQIYKESGWNEIFLFGARYENSDVRVNGEMRWAGRGNFIEFFVAEKLGDVWKAHRLLHRRSTMMTDLDEDDDCLPARKVKAAEFSLGPVPSWVKSDAYWPTLKEVPMLFVGQVGLPETEITRTLLTWNKKIFLFWLPEDDGKSSRFKIFTQPAKFQSVEAHYREEEARWRSKRRS